MKHTALSHNNRDQIQAAVLTSKRQTGPYTCAIQDLYNNNIKDNYNTGQHSFS